MAKRSRDDRRSGPPGRGQDQYPKERPGTNMGDNGHNHRGHQNKKPRLESTFGPQPPAQNTKHLLRGKALTTASLLSQLLSELKKDPEAISELEELVGPEVISQAQKLEQALAPNHHKINSQLHALPKFPPPVRPFAQFPSKLPSALSSLTINAHHHTVPPLPSIKDSSLAPLPFIHRTTHFNDHRKAVIESYERLELLGDAYIEIMATRLLYPLYPTLGAGRLSQIREKLVCNETLAAYSMAYAFADRVLVPDTYLESGTDRGKIWQKLLGDVFEAYVAALVISDPETGYEDTERWLWTLWAPLLPDAAVMQEPDKGAKQELSRLLGGVGVRFEYESQGEPEPFKGGLYWTVGVFLTGWGFERERLAVYKGRSKQVAELGAAEEAMANPLTGQVRAIKVRFDEKVKRERAEAEAKAKEGDGPGQEKEADEETQQEAKDSTSKAEKHRNEDVSEDEEGEVQDKASNKTEHHD